MSARARERDLAVRAAREAGAIVLDHYTSDVRVEQKGPDSPVTRADLEANAHIRALIQAGSLVRAERVAVVSPLLELLSQAPAEFHYIILPETL